MELLRQFIDLFLHLDQHLSQIISDYGTWTYVILFMIIFVETGVVVMPFLPGDSLLFAAGAFAATGVLNVWILMTLLFIAAFLGDTLNYLIGDYFGPKVFKRDYRFLKREYLLKTQAFYEKHGGKTIIFARFIPIIRTFAPFVAGVGTMKYSKFLSYNIIGGFIWVVGFVMAGFVFGNIPVVKKNFTLVIFGIILISILPPIIELVKQKMGSKKQ
ncbi:DedA family protein [Rufibacter glacialis]|uniref:DedA family protein n=1 Tax=Rufibacter glacialis TaxID=1259555 RepID=A0A5M8QM62_9BACT|nr:DedA family protein [Rufibacter glacialis]KAA6437235.1 DedA family protein [Rufibacter glacialis]GGK60881.1 membrane protein [Rufibacter glacialis]